MILLAVIIYLIGILPAGAIGYHLLIDDFPKGKMPLLYQSFAIKRSIKIAMLWPYYLLACLIAFVAVILNG